MKMKIVCLLTMIICISASAKEDPVLLCNWEKTSDGVIMTYDKSHIRENSEGAYMVLKPGYDFISLTPEELSENPVEHILEYKPVNLDGAFEYVLPSDIPDGRYRIRFFVSDYPDKSLTSDYSIIKISETLKTNCVEDFLSVSKEDFYEKFNNYSCGDFNIALNTDEIDGINDYAENIGSLFVEVRKAYTSEDDSRLNKEVRKFDNIDDIESCLKITSLLYNLDKKTQYAESLYNKFVLESDRLFREEISYKKFHEIFTCVKNDNLTESARLATALSFIQDGTYRDIAYSMENYYDVLKIDLSELKRANLKIEEVSVYINNDGYEKYKNGLNDAYKIALKKAENKKNKHENSTSGGGGGGSSSGSSVRGYGSGTSDNQSIKEIEYESSFNDLEGYPWAEDAICKMESKGVFNGTGNNQFLPGRNITRAEFAKSICILADIKLKEGFNNTFYDCSTKEWYYPYVSALYQSKIINGKSDNYFGASDEITRQDAFSICARVLGFEEKYSHKLYSVLPGDFNDVSPYAKGYIYNMFDKKIIHGDENNNLRPQSYITRAETAVLLNSIAEYMKHEKG